MPQQTQKPRGPDNMVCPLHKAAMSDVCDHCPLWVHVRGKNPQSEELFDAWDCSLAWMPLLLIENSQMQRQTGAAVESFRNEVVRANEETERRLGAVNLPPLMIDGSGRPR